MKLKLFTVGILCSLFLFNCSSSQSLTKSQSSVVIHLKDGSSKEGLVIKKDGENLLYMDSKTHGKESIKISDIKSLSKASVIYDFEANPIPSSVISEEKGMGNTFLYGGGGLALGTAVGFGAGLIVWNAVENKGAGVITMAACALAGGVYFSFLGADEDYEDAIFNVRQKRYAISKQKRDKEIEEAKQELKESQKKKEELQKKIDEKNKK